METVTVEIKSNKAMKLLKDLENLDIIKIHKSKEKQETKDKPLPHLNTICSYSLII